MRGKQGSMKEGKKEGREMDDGKKGERKARRLSGRPAGRTDE